MFSNKGIKPRAAMLLSGVDAWPLTSRMYGDLVAITARLRIVGTVREVVIFLCSLPSLRTGLEEKWVRTTRKLDWDLSRCTLRSKLKAGPLSGIKTPKDLEIVTSYLQHAVSPRGRKETAVELMP